MYLFGGHRPTTDGRWLFYQCPLLWITRIDECHLLWYGKEGPNVCPLCHWHQSGRDQQQLLGSVTPGVHSQSRKVLLTSSNQLLVRGMGQFSPDHSP